MENEPRFTVNGDGTVTDNETSLIWLQDAGCLPASDWSQAQQACAGLQSGECGLSDGSHPGDWRLASMDELLTLVDYHFLPALSNTQGDGPWKQGDPFLNVMTNNPYWSATPAQQNPQGLAWEDAFNNGNFYNDAQSSPRYVWPVRGTVSPPVSPRFTDNGDGTVTDNQTGLLWLKNANCFGLQVWDRAAALASALGSGQCGLNDGSQPGDWQLPGIKELVSLLDFRYIGPTVSNSAGTGPATQGDPFDNLEQNNLYWASAYVGDDKAAWVVLFSGGNMSTTMKEGFYFVWPVRNRS